MKSFNLELAKQGHPVCTRDGRQARIVSFDIDNDNYPIIALIKKEKGKEDVQSYTINGDYYRDETVSDFDLFMVNDKKTGWVNIYDEGGGHYSTGNVIYDYEHEAVDADINEQRIDTIQIEFEV